MVVFAKIITPILWVVSFSYIDAEHLNRKEWIPIHESRNVNRAVVIIIIALFDLLLAVYAWAMFFALFDFSLNVFRTHVKWNHIGSVASQDKFYLLHSKWFIPTKVLGFSFGVLVLVIRFTPTYFLALKQWLESALLTLKQWLTLCSFFT